MKLKIRYIITFFALGMMFFSCETEFTPSDAQYVEEIVVEGYIEGGEEPTPPYVILTKSQKFFSELSPNNFNGLFVNEATVTVSDGTQTVALTEVCLDNLSPAQQDLLADFLGFNADSLEVNFCIYTDLTFSMIGQIGKTYELTVETSTDYITASTTIPNHVPLDSLVFDPIPDTENDTLQELTAWINDPGNERNFYRYFTQVEEEQFFPGLTSVAGDDIFNGQSFAFPIPKGEPRTQVIDPNTYGYFLEGDTMRLKWCNLDEEHFNFWNTLEFNLQSQGPFATSTRIQSNINGGLGVWGGYSNSYYEAVVPFD